MANEKYIAVKIDMENNAEVWWSEIDEKFPKFAESLRRNDAAVITEEIWDELAALPGFGGGPKFAPNALIHCGSDGDMFADVRARRHGVFETLS